MRQNRSRRTRAASALGTLSCVIAVVVSTFFIRGLEAQSTTAQECCLTLLFPYGARAVSVGQALTARTSIDGVFFNPAALAASAKMNSSCTTPAHSRPEQRLEVVIDAGGGDVRADSCAGREGDIEIRDENGILL
jgi:hypothetical protein